MVNCTNRPGPARVTLPKSDELVLSSARLRRVLNALQAVHPKRCLIVDPKGKVVAKDAGEFDQVITATIRIDPAARQVLLERCRPELYGDIGSRRAEPAGLRRGERRGAETPPYEWSFHTCLAAVAGRYSSPTRWTLSPA